MNADPRWLEILKASGWQTLALTAAAALVVYGNAKRLFPAPLPAWAIQIAEVVFVVCGCLSLASIGPALARWWLKVPWATAKRSFLIRREQLRVAEYIPHMTQPEREIIAYLLAKNQKTFTGAADGGYANTLIARRIVVCALQRGQTFSPDEVPFTVPDHVWEILLKHKTEFPYTPPSLGATEPHPWRVSWM